MTGRRGTTARVAALLVGTLLLAACTQVPHDGPVVEDKERGAGAPAQGEYSNPKGPQPDDTPAMIVTGFLNAMTATPLRTTPAKEFLSRQAGGGWQPQRVVTYHDHTLARGGDRVVVRLLGADQVGPRGQWQGSLPPAARRLVFPMVREDNEWRIAQVPDALIIPRTFYDRQYQPANIYFFDPTGRILVPEPVHVPEGSQLASALVRALVSGPGRSSSGVVRSFLPLGLSPVLSVPVANNGVADVSLKGPDPGPLGRRSTRLILAQLSWTLRQDASITAFTLTIAGRTITDASGDSRFSVGVDAFSEYDPSVATASGQTYALRRGRLVSGPVNNLTKVGGPFGKTRSRVGAFAVNLDSTWVAGVTPDSLLMGRTDGSTAPTTILTGSGLLRPSWDFAGRLWEVQVTSGRAVVTYVAQNSPHRVRVPGITGKNVSGFVISRDGSRIVAVLRGPGADRIVTSRIRYDGDGVALGATRARPIRWNSRGTTRIRDIGWTTPTTIAVLDQEVSAKAEIRILSVDGSTRSDQAPPTQITGHVRGLATAPGQTPYAVLQSSLSNMSPDQIQNRPIPILGLHHLTYAG